MGDHNNSIATRMDFAKLFHDYVRAATVEIAGRFVG